MCETFGGGRHEEIGAEGGREVDACGVVDGEAVDEIGVVESKLHRDPAAHGPAADVSVRDAHGVHEGDDGGLLHGDGVGDVGAWGAAVAREVGRVHVVATGGHGRDHHGP